MPAFTMAAACRYALTGVGAAMAPGSQKWNGTRADLLSAPTSTQISATGTSGPVTGWATSSPSEYEPPSIWPRMTMPASIARPPKVVTINARHTGTRAHTGRGTWWARVGQYG